MDRMGSVTWRVLDDEREYGTEGLSTTRKGYEETVGWWEDSHRVGIVVDPDALRALVAQANRAPPTGAT